jgi:hypothetical protein
MLDAAAAAEKDRRRVRQKDPRKWIECRLDLANSPPLPFAPCIPVIAERLDRGRIFEQPTFHERLDLMEGHGRRAAGGRPTS